LSIEDDYFIPVRGGESGTKIDTLAGGQNAAAVEDVAYIQKKLFAALKIPRAYLGYDEMLSSKATLAQEDIRFSRTINVIQKVLIAELNKLAIIHLYSNGFDEEQLQNFTLHLSNPSTVAQQQKLELWRSKFEIAGAIPEGMGSKEFARKKIWGLTDEEIEEIDEQRYKEKIKDQEIENAKPPEEEGGEAGGEEGGGGDLFGGGEEGGEEEAGGGGEEGGEEAGGGGEAGGEEGGGGGDLFADDDPEDRPDTRDAELLLAGDDVDDFEIPLFEKDGPPLKARNSLEKALYNRSRRRHNGRSKTHMPKFAGKEGMLDLHTLDVKDDPTGSKELKRMVSLGLNESKSKKESYQRTFLTADVSSALKKMTAKLGVGTRRGVILEDEDRSEKDLLNERVDRLFNKEEL